MNRLILCSIFVFTLSGCNAQQKGEASISADSLETKPQTRVIVNKEYDEDGNLIGFDSTYSYYYSNIQQDSLFGDSNFVRFRKDFFNSFPLRQRPFLNDLFFEDSLLSYDFYKDDFFTKRFQLNRERFDKLFKEMDSLKNSFYENNINPPKNEK
jgi:hypothetical protein